MDPAPPIDVKAEQNGATDYSPPINSKITWNFPANEYSAKEGFQINWYDGFVNASFDRDSWSLKKDGDAYNHPSDDVLEGMDFEEFGSVVIGEEGKLFFNRSKPNWVLKVGRHIDSFKSPPQSLPRAAEENNYLEWYQAVQGDVQQGQSNFALAGRMTETILLGVLAQRFPGETLKWNADSLSVEGRPELAKYIRREYADGWKTKALFGW